MEKIEQVELGVHHFQTNPSASWICHLLALSRRIGDQKQAGGIGLLVASIQGCIMANLDTQTIPKSLGPKGKWQNNNIEIIIVPQDHCDFPASIPISLDLSILVGQCQPVIHKPWQWLFLPPKPCDYICSSNLLILALSPKVKAYMGVS